MRVLHWCLIGFLTWMLPVESKYRFRFHTCIKEDQAILDRENLVSLRQMAFIDDGSFGGRKQRRLSEFGIGIEHGSLLKDFTKEYPVGAESTIHFIHFRGSEYLLLINFWSRSYYFVKKGEKINIRKAGKTLKPSFEHFVRVYFICAPGNARSALILFGEQAKLRKVAPQNDGGGESKETQTPKTPKKPKKRSPVSVTQKTADNSTVTLRKCRKRGLRKKRAAGSPKRQFSKKIIRKTAKDERRLARRALLVYRVRIVFVYLGFGIAIIINCFVLIPFFKIYKKLKIPPAKIDTDGEENGKNNEKPGNGSGTTETKTNSEKKEK
ncbi:unnamed protein product [Caenorhabditis nigoni]